MNTLYKVTVTFSKDDCTKYCHTICVTTNWQDAQIIVEALRARLPSEQRSEMSDSKVHTTYEIEHRVMHQHSARVYVGANRDD